MLVWYDHTHGSCLCVQKKLSHFPTEVKQCRKLDQRSDICFLKAKRVYKKTSLTIKSNKSGFWSYFKSKLRNFETRFQARYYVTCGHVSRDLKRVSRFLNFDMRKLEKPDFFDLMVNEVFKYTLLAFRKHMSLLRRNFLHCLSSVGKCDYVSHISTKDKSTLYIVS